MKKLLAILLALAVMLSFAACGADKAENTDGDEKVTTSDKANDNTDTKTDKETEATTTGSSYGEIKDGEIYTCEVCEARVPSENIHIKEDGIWKTYMCTDCYNSETAE